MDVHEFQVKAMRLADEVRQKLATELLDRYEYGPGLMVLDDYLGVMDYPQVVVLINLVRARFGRSDAIHDAAMRRCIELEAAQKAVSAGK